MLSVQVPGAPEADQVDYTATVVYKDERTEVRHTMTTEGASYLMPWLPIGSPSEWLKMMERGEGALHIDLRLDYFDIEDYDSAGEDILEEDG